MTLSVLKSGVEPLRETKVGGDWKGEFVGGLVGWPILDPCWSDSFKSLPTVTEKRERVGATTSVFSD